ncbi:MAG: ComEC/Rec2 family competence protein [Pseudomonadota bacterium]
MLDEEYHRLNLWYFVSFISGILFYFSLKHEPSMHHVAGVFIGSFAALFLRRYGVPGIFLSGILIAFSYGVFISKYRETGLGGVALQGPISASVAGDVSSMKPTVRGVQIVLSDAKCNKVENFPKQIRVNVKTEHAKKLMIGDRIKLFAFLNPPPRSVLPGGYDFGLYAYFSGIGAVGYGLSEPRILNSGHSSVCGNDKMISEDNSRDECCVNKYGFNSMLQDLRRKVYYRLIEVMGADRGNFAAAILLGEGSGLNRDIMQNMRLAGISHILCVSGLHLTLVAMLFFTSSRILLNLSDKIAFKFDIKSVSAVISLVGSFCYLLVSGTQIAATRAFIMTAIFIFSVMIGRSPYPLRSMGLAAVVILSMNPEYVMHPSFQLSFVAVLSLIAGYEFYVRNQWIFGNSKGVFATIKLHLFSNIYSSLVASAATTPIVIYHFYISSNYSILANLIAVPMMSFFMMPIVILAVMVMPFHLDYYILKLLGYGVQIVIETADYVTHMPGNIWYFGYITPLPTPFLK